MAGNRPLYWKRTRRPAGPSSSIQASPVPCSNSRCWAGSSCTNGVSSENRRAGQRLGETQERACSPPDRARRPRAPSRSERWRVADQQRRAGSLLHAQAFAGRTPAERTVEREMMRIQRLETAAAAVAGEVLTEALDAPVRFRFVVHRHGRRASRRGRDPGPASTASARRVR